MEINNMEKLIIQYLFFLLNKYYPILIFVYMFNYTFQHTIAQYKYNK